MSISIYEIKQRLTERYEKRTPDEIQQLMEDGEEDLALQSLTPLIIDYVGKYYYRSDYEDILGVALYGCMKGLRTYDSNFAGPKATIVSYCKTCAKNEVYLYDKKCGTTIRRPSNYLSLSEEERELIAKCYVSDDMTKYDLSDDYEAYREVKITREELQDILIDLPKITQRHIDIFLDYYLSDKRNQIKTGDKFGITKARVGQVIKIVITKINKNKTIMNKLAKILF